MYLSFIVSVVKMSKQRLRPSLFPEYAPYLNFVGPGEEYEEGEDIAQEFTVARGTGPVIMRCLNKFGFKVIEVNLFYWSNLTKQILFAVDIKRPEWCQRSCLGPASHDQ